MSYLRIGAFAGALIAGAAFSVAAHATTLTSYSTVASYNAATTGNTTVNFAGIAPAGGYVTETVPPGVSVGGINFTINTSGSNGSLYVVDAGFANNFTGATVLDAQFSTAANDNILITLPTAVTAAAFDFGSSSGLNVGFLFSNGATFSASTIGNTVEFLGVTSSTPFSTIELSQATGAGLLLQDFTAGTAVPEPSSFSLLAIGVLLAGAGLCLRKGKCLVSPWPL